MKLKDYFTYLETTNDEQLYYLSNWLFAKVDPSLLDDYKVPDFFSDDWLQLLPSTHSPELRWIFIGGKV